MAIFRCESGANWIISRNLHEKLGKNVRKIFFWIYEGEKWTFAKIDHFTKNGPMSSKLSLLERDGTRTVGQIYLKIFYPTRELQESDFYLQIRDF